MDQPFPETVLEEVQAAVPGVVGLRMLAQRDGTRALLVRLQSRPGPLKVAEFGNYEVAGRYVRDLEASAVERRILAEVAAFHVERRGR